MKKEIELWLIGEVYSKIGIDRPDNHDKIIKYIKEDVKETADPTEYHTGDFAIAFRRMLEEYI